MKALVIDDDRVVRMVLKRLLTRFFPYSVLEAENGLDGIAAVVREHPAVVFCDVNMPKLDGVGFLKQIRSDPLLADLPVIAISAGHDREMVLKLMELGISDYLLKPLDLEQTYRRLERLLPGLIEKATEREARRVDLAETAAAQVATAATAASAALAAQPAAPTPAAATGD